MQRVPLQNDLLALKYVGVGQVHRQNRVGVMQVRPQQQRLEVVDRQFEPRQKPGVVVKQAIRSALGGANVTMAIQNHEGVAMLERRAWPAADSGGRDIE